MVRETFKDNAGKSISKESVGRKEVGAVMVSRLPEGVTENSVHIHFQKKKNGGGEIEKVIMLGKGKAVVLFEKLAGTWFVDILEFISYLNTDEKMLRQSRLSQEGEQILTCDRLVRSHLVTRDFVLPLADNCGRIKCLPFKIHICFSSTN